jgi:hypothetical protein
MSLPLKARRGPTWKELQELLLDEEKTQLASVEQCSRWAARQEAKRPRWTLEKASRLAQCHDNGLTNLWPTNSLAKC